jgi:PleD family two-component response regulator
MDTSFDYIGLADKPALLALTSPDWQEAARAALTELGYKVHQCAAHSDFLSNFNQVQYDVVVIEDGFAAHAGPENLSLQFLQNAQMALRRHSVIILVGDFFTTFDALQAFQQGAQLVVNRGEMPVLAQFIQKCVSENDLFLNPYREAQKRLTHAAA